MPPTVLFSAYDYPGGGGAIGVGIISGGVVVGVTITNAGSGYGGPPRVSFTDIVGYVSAADEAAFANTFKLSAYAGSCWDCFNLGPQVTSIPLNSTIFTPSQITNTFTTCGLCIYGPPCPVATVQMTVSGLSYCGCVVLNGPGSRAATTLSGATNWMGVYTLSLTNSGQIEVINPVNGLLSYVQGCTFTLSLPWVITATVYQNEGPIVQLAPSTYGVCDALSYSTLCAMTDPPGTSSTTRVTSSTTLSAYVSLAKVYNSEGCWTGNWTIINAGIGIDLSVFGGVSGWRMAVTSFDGLALGANLMSGELVCGCDNFPGKNCGGVEYPSGDGNPYWPSGYGSGSLYSGSPSLVVVIP